MAIIYGSTIVPLVIVTSVVSCRGSVSSGVSPYPLIITIISGLLQYE